MMHGGRRPGPHTGMGAKGKKADRKTIVRLLSYMKEYKLHLILVALGIIISAVTGVIGSTFIKTMIDTYIDPLLDGVKNGIAPDYTNMVLAIIRMACIYLIGLLCTFGYNRLMVTVAQGVQKKVRDGMFEHMQTLPIKYFDTHAHGDVMSCYTNDTDTLRQLISQSVPQLFSSAVTVISVFIHMDDPYRAAYDGGHHVGSQDNRRQERQILRAAAKIPGRCKRLH